jgi:hypothetical protein
VAASDGCTNRLADYLDVGLAEDGSSDSEGGGEGSGGRGGVQPLGGSGAEAAAAAAEAAAAAVGVELGRVLREEEFLALFLCGGGRGSAGAARQSGAV